MSLALAVVPWAALEEQAGRGEAHRMALESLIDRQRKRQRGANEATEFTKRPRREQEYETPEITERASTSMCQVCVKAGFGLAISVAELAADREREKALRLEQELTAREQKLADMGAKVRAADEAAEEERKKAHKLDGDLTAVEAKRATLEARVTAAFEAAEKERERVWRICKLEGELMVAQGKLAELGAKVNAADEAIEEERKKAQKSDGVLTSTEAKVATLEARLTAAIEASEAERERAYKLEGELIAGEQNLVEVRAEVTAIDKAAEERCRKARRLEEELTAAKVKLADLGAKATAADKAAEEERRRAQGMAEKLLAADKFVESVCGAQNVLWQAEQNLVAMSKQLIGKEEHCYAQDRQLSAQHQQLIVFSQQLSAKDHQLIEKDQQIAFKDLQMTKAAQHSAGIEKSALDETSLAMQREQELQAAKEVVEHQLLVATKHLGDCEARVRDLVRDLVAEKNAVEHQLTAKIAELRGKVSGLVGQKEDAERQLEWESLEELETRIGELEAQKDVLREQLEAKQGRVEELEDGVTSLAADKEAALHELEQLKGVYLPECAICFEPWSKEVKRSALMCGHASYCSRCLQRYLESGGHVRTRSGRSSYYKCPQDCKVKTGGVIELYF